ncbi:response regulator [Patescibacteria group bacterium]|nr:response regulator [Patescibacteria group bacterium]
MKKILIIEDNKELAEFYKLTLEDKGYEATILEDFDSYLVEIKDKEIDLILLDLLLGEKSGQEILGVIKEKSSVPVIVITNLPTEKKECLALGADGFFVKSETGPEGILGEVARVIKNET